MASVAGNGRGRRPDYLLVRMTQTERRRYRQWWIESSGLTRLELRKIANGIWADRLARYDGRS